ncbi:General transcription factor IIH subunit 3 [Nosema bombycis CQ1]|uniref:General transcription and DNA repair factor IIH subunit TFB4 n=1 Tax=Nosema bombycis (strain CQ1 / CVCC 102059) TaxID=578461 RepID=R0M540_NOSB1|nr:General transcription factor IIH subunit 3 [Nosema bombycis CQ1]|eukprot:EOB13124.1 General transcription factor IIH subunit 3 [Nosema bombycis CQ1]
MLLHLLIDFKKENWAYVKRDLYNDLLIFLNSYRLSNLENHIEIVQNKALVWDSRENDLLSLSEIEDSFNVNDLGFVLCKTKFTEVKILIFTLHKVKESDFLKYLKAMYTAQRFNIVINVFSLVKNPILKQCATVTGGFYSDDEDSCLRLLISTLGILKTQNVQEYLVKCYCHDKIVSLGLTCPICLAVYCKFVPVCKRCKTKFNFIKNK